MTGKKFLIFLGILFAIAMVVYVFTTRAAATSLSSASLTETKLL